MDYTNQQHWDNVFCSKKEGEASWFQPYPETSIKFLDLFKLSPEAHIIDIGGGDSRFADALLDKGFRNVYVLDISSKAIEKARHRLGERESQVNWVVADITEYQPQVKFDLWHDRAAFHFLTSEKKIYQYTSIAEDSIKPGGHLVLGTFSENGPDKCSGLAIKKYSEVSMSETFETSFERIKCFTEDHITPSQKKQNFLFCSFKRK